MSFETRIPHSLRIPILLLRIAIGANFFWLGWSALFAPASLNNPLNRTLAGLYAWLLASPQAMWIEWIFLIGGAVIAIGFATRLASVILAGITLGSLWPVHGSHFSPALLLGDAPIIAIGLAILFFAKAGAYFGLDAFFHFSFRHHKNK